MISKEEVDSDDDCPKNCALNPNCAYWSLAWWPKYCRLIPFGVLDMSKNRQSDGNGRTGTRFCYPPLPKICPEPTNLTNTVNNYNTTATTYTENTKVK